MRSRSYMGPWISAYVARRGSAGIVCLETLGTHEKCNKVETAEDRARKNATHGERLQSVVRRASLPLNLGAVPTQSFSSTKEANRNSPEAEMFRVKEAEEKQALRDPIVLREEQGKTTRRFSTGVFNPAHASSNPDTSRRRSFVDITTGDVGYFDANSPLFKNSNAKTSGEVTATGSRRKSNFEEMFFSHKKPDNDIGVARLEEKDYLNDGRFIGVASRIADLKTKMQEKIEESTEKIITVGGRRISVEARMEASQWVDRI